MEALRIHGNRKFRAEFNCRLICKQRVAGPNPAVGSKFDTKSGAPRLTGPADDSPEQLRRSATEVTLKVRDIAMAVKG